MGYQASSPDSFYQELGHGIDRQTTFASADEKGSFFKVHFHPVPDVELIRDSRDVISRELGSLESLLHELHTFVCRGAEVRAGAVQGAEGWRELHYSTGQKDDGRIYFRRTGTKVRALVSFKREQGRDIEYLRRRLV